VTKAGWVPDKVSQTSCKAPELSGTTHIAPALARVSTWHESGNGIP